VHPNPLVWILPDNLFDDSCEALSVHKNILFRITGAGQFDRRLKSEAVFVEVGVPNSVSGDDGSIGVQRNARNARGSTSGFSKEIYKNSFVGHGVLVCEDAHGATLLQDFEHGASGFILEDWVIAGEAAVRIYKVIYTGIVNMTRHVMERIAVKGVGEGGEFPGAEVAGQKEHAFAATMAFQKILMAIEDEDLLDILFGASRKSGELDGHPAEIADHGEHKALALGGGHDWKRNFEIDLRGLAQTRQGVIEEFDQRDREKPRLRFGKAPKDLEEAPYRGELEPGNHHAVRFIVNGNAGDRVGSLAFEENRSMLNSCRCE